MASKRAVASGIVTIIHSRYLQTAPAVNGAKPSCDSPFYDHVFYSLVRLLKNDLYGSFVRYHKINIASPNEKNRYLSFTASS